MMQQRKPISIVPKPDEIEPAVRAAFRALGKGNPTPGQCATVLSFLTVDLCQVRNIPDPNMSERQSGYTDGQRRIGIVVSDLAGVRTIIDANEADDE